MLVSVFFENMEAGANPCSNHAWAKATWAFPILKIFQSFQTTIHKMLTESGRWYWRQARGGRGDASQAFFSFSLTTVLPSPSALSSEELPSKQPGPEEKQLTFI